MLKDRRHHTVLIKSIEIIYNFLKRYRSLPKTDCLLSILCNTCCLSKMSENFRNPFKEHHSFWTGGTYLDLDSVPLSSINPIRNHSAVQAGTFSYSLANAVIIGAPNNLFHWLFYLNYFKYQPKAWAANSVLKGMELAKLYPETIYVEYSYIFRPNVPERFYYFTKGWLWNWSQHYTVHLFAR